MTDGPQPSQAEIVVPPMGDLDEKIPCPICRELIFRGAKLCIHCKSDLTWKRYLSISNTTLALLTALIAVVGTVGPQLQRMYFGENSRLTAAVLGEAPESGLISVLVTNEGTRPGYVGKSSLILPIIFYDDEAAKSGVDVQSEMYLSLDLVDGNKSPVESKTSREVLFRIRPDDDVRAARRVRRPGKVASSAKFDLWPFTDCTLRLHVISSRGDDGELRLNFGCERLESLLAAETERSFGRPRRVRPANGSAMNVAASAASSASGGKANR